YFCRRQLRALGAPARDPGIRRGAPALRGGAGAVAARLGLRALRAHGCGGRSLLSRPRRYFHETGKCGRKNFREANRAGQHRSALLHQAETDDFAPRDGAASRSDGPAPRRTRAAAVRGASGLFPRRFRSSGARESIDRQSARHGDDRDLGELVAVQTLIAGIDGMNFEHMPEIQWQHGYPVSLLVMAVIDFYLFYRFRRAKWL